MRRNAARFRVVLCLMIPLALLSSVLGYAWAESEPVDVRGAILWTRAFESGVVSGARIRVFSWLEAGFSMAAEDLFEPEIRVHLLENLPPVRTALVVAPERIGFFTQLRLGPVHAVMGRAWGLDAVRWASVTVADARTMSLSVGWRSPGGFSAEICVRFVSEMVWDLSLFFRDGSVGVGGAVWR